MLIYAAQYVAERGGNHRNLVLHGQERNLGTLAIGKLNLLLHGLRSARYEGGDVIVDPQLRDEGGRLLAYDRVIANPPFSLKEWGRDFAPTTLITASTASERSRPRPRATSPSSSTCSPSRTPRGWWAW